MATIKKVKIPVSSLPVVDENNNYILRYRIVSDDKNRTSHWSPFLRVAGPAVTTSSGAISVTINSITTTWYDTPRRASYDIFVRYGDYNPATQQIVWGSYAYAGTSLSQSFTVLNNVTATNIGVLVQISGNKTLNPSLQIFEDVALLRAQIDGGNASGV